MSQSFQVGGSISGQTSIYIPRRADQELFDALVQGELCYVFNSRQMGKSSLLLEVKTRLQQQGVKCCFLDLSRVGSVNITEQQWFAGIISELWRGFELPPGQAMLSWWHSLGDIPPALKLASFFQGKLLSAYPDQEMVVFFDEIDAVLSLPFPADDFFSVLRACYNLRADDARMSQIRFAFFGVALPSDLIEDERRSPFNIGRAIAMEGFSEQEAQPLSQGLICPGRNPSQVLSAILQCSGGQPFLTQKLCQMINDASADGDDDANPDTQAWVDGLVNRRLINDWESHDNPEHLRTIRDRMLLDEKYSTVNLAGYAQLLSSPDETLPVESAGDYHRLYLTGLIAVQQGTIRPRTQVYRRVFDEHWLQAQLDQRRPYAKALHAWQQGNTESLLQGSELQAAIEWAEGKHLPEIDHRFLGASREQVQQQVQQWNQRLQAEVEQRQQAQLKLQEALDQLEHAKRDAEQANQAKTDFLTRVSREVRTPINSVLGLSHLALRHVVHPRNRDYLQKINRATRHMLAVVDDMVDINKLERGELALKREPFLLDTVLDNLLDMIAPSLNSKGLSFALHQPQQLLPPLMGDAERLQQLLLNLANNAVLYTESGGIELQVAQLSSSERRLSLRFSLIDTGCGVADRPTQGRVNRTGASVMKPGLGLSFCCELLSLLGSALEVESDPAHGSHFFFDLSFEADDQATSPPDSGWQVVLAQSASRSGSTISEQLLALGHQTQEVSLSDLNQVEWDRYDRLIVDIASLTDPTVLLPILDRYPTLSVHPLLALGEQLPEGLELLALKPALSSPCSLRRLAQDLAATRAVARPVANAQPQQQYRVLVAEDDEFNQQVVIEMLGQLGLSVVLVGDGRAALDALSEQAFDLILMDIEMPVMDGLEAVARLRKRPQFSLEQLPVIAMTAHAMVGDRKRFLAAGMNDHLTKPLDPARLNQVLNRWLPMGTPAIPLSPELARLELADLYDIDTATGLSRCDGQWDRYLSLLKQFATDYRDGLAFSDLPLDELSRRCHELINQASRLGLDVIADSAGELEQLCRLGQSPNPNQLHALSLLLKKRCRQILSRSEHALKSRHHTASNSAHTASGVQKPVLILVDQTPARYQTQITELKSDYKVMIANHADKALALLKQVEGTSQSLKAMVVADIGDDEAALSLCVSACAQLQPAPLLLATASTDPDFVSQALAKGVSDVLPLPLNLTLLKRRLSHLPAKNR
ncbi:response regulator [Ferrimonas marina]|uniref:histidine kinase n=1 Tax=Ferrimonas marina TaxID=299255 RepID=A0A1M5MKT7_9GAMM|nr:response regulator [Ferrimonas marina]SHG78054.1 Signal transduction histidine kinase [Ferrimonas marina]